MPKSTSTVQHKSQRLSERRRSRSRSTSHVHRGSGSRAAPKPLFPASDGTPCPKCSKLLKNSTGLLKHLHRAHKEPTEPETLIVNTPLIQETEPSSQAPNIPQVQDSVAREQVSQVERIISFLTTGTEIAGTVLDGVVCGVCFLRVERERYGTHLGAHVQAARVQFAYLGEVLERTAASVQSVNNLMRLESLYSNLTSLNIVPVASLMPRPPRLTI